MNDRDLLFCELLFELGSVNKACEQLDIPLRQGRKIAERSKDIILAMTNTELASLAYMSVNTIRSALTEDGSTPKAEIRLKAAEAALDRIGASKKVQGEVEVKIDTPIILMPAKDNSTIPTILVSSQDEP